MGYEIDFLPVGEESKGGDAIALRYGNLYGSRRELTVIVAPVYSLQVIDRYANPRWPAA
ncbi:hypothetical protein ACH437_29400 [Streptomyces xinghaiensis]|uniref:hypothetical protein n=1 Tax=Streptomyces xinghaiensis TaxID=1038928 RepID=UPI0037B152D3